MQKENVKPNFEFVALMASLMSITALAIDAILPGLSKIGLALNSVDSTDNQMLIIMIFLGLGLGQLFFGPLSDSYGRKPMIYIGFFVFFIASLTCVFAPTMGWMIFGRILQGVGLSAARSISVSIIRDTYKGDYMAKVMSFVTAFFILVPVVAPAMGKAVLDHWGWQAIFYVQLVCAFIVVIWFWKRQPETLKIEYKIPFSRHVFMDGFLELIRYRATLAFTIISGLITGSFLVYLSAAQQVFEEQYNMADEFPYIFAGLAVSIGIATFLNGTLVLKLGMRKLAFIALIVFFSVSLLYVLLFWNSSNPGVIVLLAFLSAQFFSLGFLFGNLRSIAMEPIGHIAGIGAAITGFVSTIISIPIATYVGSFVEHTVLPLFLGLAVCGFVSLLIFILIKRKQRVVVT
ncbi:multidrug effflux MFS transporter [Maribacter sp.]|uniref:multidrug effflux MFS transporter n=1 Tax=Maribacter sp. TaxID=1897614 RepID=UPI0025BBEF92|nr:multidrug effflux MFS transporter [Maribacter sp.]